MKAITDKAEITYTIECLPEDMSVESGMFQREDGTHDTELIEQIRNDYASGNDWAWCCIKVTARIDGIPLEGVDYLGGCSYRDQAEFEACGYFEDMKKEARASLIKQIEAVKAIEI